MCLHKKDVSPRRLFKQSLKWTLGVEFETIGTGFRMLRLFNDPGAFYQRTADQGTASAKQFDRTFAFLILLQRWAIWWFLHDHILRLTVQFTMLLTYSDKQCLRIGSFPPFPEFHLDCFSNSKPQKCLLLVILNNIQKVFQGRFCYCYYLTFKS